MKFSSAFFDTWCSKLCKIQFKNCLCVCVWQLRRRNSLPISSWKRNLLAKRMHMKIWYASNFFPPSDFNFNEFARNWVLFFFYFDCRIAAQYERQWHSCSLIILYAKETENSNRKWNWSESLSVRMHRKTGKKCHENGIRTKKKGIKRMSRDDDSDDDKEERAKEFLVKKMHSYANKKTKVNRKQAKCTGLIPYNHLIRIQNGLSFVHSMRISYRHSSTSRH